MCHATFTCSPRKEKDFTLGGWPLTLELLRNLNTIPNGGVMVRRSFFDGLDCMIPISDATHLRLGSVAACAGAWREVLPYREDRRIRNGLRSRELHRQYDRLGRQDRLRIHAR